MEDIILFRSIQLGYFNYKFFTFKFYDLPNDYSTTMMIQYFNIVFDYAYDKYTSQTEKIIHIL